MVTSTTKSTAVVASADWVTAELQRLGLEVEEDDAGPRAGSDSGNLLTRIAGAGTDSILLCAHLDTVPLTAPVEPVLVDGGFENANEGILGADNKSAVAIMIELARRLRVRSDPPLVGLELLFTVCEEVGLLGSREFDASRLGSRSPRFAAKTDTCERPMRRIASAS